MGDNLPPGVTPADIDKHFGEPEKREVGVELMVAVTFETQYWDDESELMEEAVYEVESNNFDVIDMDVIEVL